MCGFGGWLGRDPADPGATERLLEAALADRGPDGGDRLEVPGMRLVWRRLAVRGRGEAAGRIAGREGSVRCALVGEIDDASEHEERLARHGLPVGAGSDARVLPALYLRDPARFPAGLSGAFALALWHPERRRLVLAVDPVGKRPLYFRAAEGRFAFASEPGALVRAGLAPARPDVNVLRAALARGFVWGRPSAFAGVERLLPGERLVVSLDDPTRPKIERWAGWMGAASESESDAGPGGVPGEDLERRIERLLLQAVRRRLEGCRSAVLLLSGGIDSGLVAWAVSRLGADLPAFTARVPHEGFDEAALAKETADRLGLRVEEVEIRAQEGEDPFAAAASVYDEPLFDSSAYATARLVRAAAAEGRVGLSGDGGDELFGGYRRHRAQVLAEMLRAALPRACVDRLARRSRAGGGGEAGRFLSGLPLEPAARHRRWTAPQGAALLERVAAGAGGGDGAPGGAAPSALRALALALAVDRTEYLPGDLIPKIERPAVRAGLEVRCPWLDDPLRRLAGPTVPRAWGLLRRTKPALRRFAAGRLPRAVVRAPKRGFGVPLSRWLLGPWRAALDERLDPARWRGRGVVDPEAGRALRDAHEAGKVRAAGALYALGVLDAWFARWIERTEGDGL